VSGFPQNMAGVVEDEDDPGAEKEGRKSERFATYVIRLDESCVRAELTHAA